MWRSVIANTLLPEAYSKAETWNNVAHGFKVAGICSMDRALFSEHDYVTSENLNSELTVQFF